jgi:Domain of unknown function (DUF4124)
MNFTRCSLAVFALLALLTGGNAPAQERKAFKVVDAAGNVTYTQTPPVDSKDAKKVEKVDIAPAQRGRGGYAGGHAGYDTRYHGGQASYDYQERYAAANQAGTKAREQRAADLKAECERQRGTDCNNPRALQYLDSTSIPRRAR